MLSLYGSMQYKMLLSYYLAAPIFFNSHLKNESPVESWEITQSYKKSNNGRTN